MRGSDIRLWQMGEQSQHGGSMANSPKSELAVGVERRDSDAGGVEGVGKRRLEVVFDKQDMSLGRKFVIRVLPMNCMRETQGGGVA